MYEETIAEMQIRAPAERNAKLAGLLEAVNADMQLNTSEERNTTTSVQGRFRDIVTRMADLRKINDLDWPASAPK